MGKPTKTEATERLPDKETAAENLKDPSDETGVGADTEHSFQEEEFLLSEKYSAQEDGRRPEVKNQGSSSTCWALAAVSALEAAVRPQQNLSFSADHLVQQNAFTVQPEEGGDSKMIMAYLSSWQGPVAADLRLEGETEAQKCETESQWLEGETDAQETANPVVHVQEMQLLDGAGVQELKTAVQKYGAVQTSLYMNRSTVSGDTSFYNADTYAYYCAEDRTQDHDIIILGWDDSFSRKSFRQTPDCDGAFLCQNSWGNDFGDDGLFYVSYADANIGKAAIAYTRIESADNYDRICQNDDCGWQGRQGYADETCWFANVYRANEGEKLAAAGFYCVGKDTSYKLYLAEGLSAPSDLSSRRLLKEGSFAYPGYYTVELGEEIVLAAGERFALIVEIRTPGEKNPVAVEYQTDETQNVTLNGKYGFISHDGENWEHTESRYGSNVCLKGYLKM